MNNKTGILGCIVGLAIISFLIFRWRNDKNAGIAKMKALKSY